MNVELHIEELVLDGFEPHQQHEIADALRERLGSVLAERGVPPGLRDVGAVDAGTISSADTGAGAADAIYDGLSR